eukprot:jgi/Hompol1/5842/HPOL_000794-RA
MLFDKVDIQFRVFPSAINSRMDFELKLDRFGDVVMADNGGGGGETAEDAAVRVVAAAISAEIGAGDKPRKRTSKACDMCRKQKQKCNGGQPCAACTVRGSACVYSQPVRKRGPPPGYFSNVMQRLRELEAKVADAQLPPDAASTQPAAPLSATATATATATTSHPASVTSSASASASPPGPSVTPDSRTLNSHLNYGSPPASNPDADMLLSVVSALESHYSNTAAAANASSPTALSFLDQSQSQSQTQTQTQTQPEEQQQHMDLSLISPFAFTPSPPHPRPLISSQQHQPQHQQQLATDAHAQIPAIPGPNVPLLLTYFDWFNTKIPLFDQTMLLREVDTLPSCLLQAMYALASTAPRPDGSFTYNAGEQYYLAAKLALDSSLESPTLHIVAATILLAAYAAGSGRGTTSTVLVATGLRIAQQLKLDREGDVFIRMSRTLEHQEFRRRLWFQLVEIDFCTAFATNMPFLVPHGAQLRVLAPSSSVDDAGKHIIQPIVPNASTENASHALSTNEISYVFAQSLSSQTDSSMLSAGDEHNVWKHMIKLQDLARRVVMFRRLTHASHPDDDDEWEPINEDEERANLDAALQEWFDQLPLYMQTIAEDYSVDPTSICPPTWRVAYMQAFYFFIRMSVHQAVIPRIAEQTGTIPIPAKDPSLIKARELARSLTKLTIVFLEKNPYFYHVSPLIGRMMFHGGLIHVLLMRCEDADLLEQNSFVDVHVRALKNISMHFLPCAHEAKIVEAFRSYPFRPVSTRRCPSL